ncbi:MAG TPA: hypothetical protein VFE24_06870 [Pirellulales bacterium]|jgi:hypothetical protein|nr:hypothetical protein [Pirellulales bacterium]
MPRFQLILCERTGRWSAELRRAGILPLRETRSLSECSDALRGAARAAVLMELDAVNLAAASEWLAERERAFPFAQTSVALPCALQSQEPWLRELGVRQVLYRDQDVEPFVRRLRQRQTPIEPSDEELLHELLTDPQSLRIN